VNELSRNSRQMIILHVEDQEELVRLVRMAFESFGFQGEILRAGLVAEAVALLDKRRRQKEPLELILADMNLPDGSGLDILRRVKASITWRMTPVIVLSGEKSPDLINEAYALGANCYLPKQGGSRGVIASLQALYQCWIKEARLPHPIFPDLVQSALSRGIRVQARMARFYLRLAQRCRAEPEQEKFWLERSLAEGNKSNLLAFFRGQISDRDVPPGAAENAIRMQRKIEQTLDRMEPLLAQRPAPAPAEVCRWVLELVNAWNEETSAETFGSLFSANPAVTLALKAQAVGQLRELARYILQRSQEPDLRQSAEALLSLAGRMEDWDLHHREETGLAPGPVGNIPET
jgi:CheY-like chemotaxis protein